MMNFVNLFNLCHTAIVCLIQQIPRCWNWKSFIKCNFDWLYQYWQIQNANTVWRWYSACLHQINSLGICHLLWKGMEESELSILLKEARLFFFFFFLLQQFWGRRMYSRHTPCAIPRDTQREENSIYYNFPGNLWDKYCYLFICFLFVFYTRHHSEAPTDRWMFPYFADIQKPMLSSEV